MATNTQPPTEHSSQIEVEKLPAPAGRAPTVTLNTPIGGEKRAEAVRIRLPRDPEKLAELPDDIEGALVQIIDEVASKSPTDQIEVLMYNGPFGLEIIMHPTPATVDRRHMQTTLDDFGRQVHSPVVEATTDAAVEILPEMVGIEVGTLDLTPIGVTDVTTMRLLSKHSQQVTQSGKFDGSPLTQLFSTCQRGHIPFIYSVILEKNKKRNRYNVAVRMALYRPEYNYSGDKGFAKLVENGHPLDLSKPFAPYNLTSNVDGLADGYWKASYNKRVDGGVDYSLEHSYRYASRYTPKAVVRKNANKLKTLALGKTEHRKLLLGNASWDPAYKEHANRHGRFSITPPQLYPFVELVKFQFATNPWLLNTGRSHPEFHRTERIRPVDENIQSDSEGTLYLSEDSNDLANEGSKMHQNTGQFTRTWFTEQGDEIRKVKQTSESVPDDVLLTDDGYIVALDTTLECENDEVAVEVETKNPEKPSNTLVNVERAIERDQHVILVYTEEFVARGYSHLAQTFRGWTDNGAHLYNRTTEVQCPDGRIPIWKGSGNGEWFVDGKTLEARVDGTVIARGDIDADVGTFDYGSDELEVYYYVDEDNSNHIETADGEIVVEHISEARLKANWTRLYHPHIPRDVSYLSHATILYHDTEAKELKPYTEDSEFDTEDLDIELGPQSGKRDRYKAGIHTFCDNYLVEQEGGKIRYEELIARAGTWFGERSSLGIPHESEIGRAFPDEIKDAKKGATNNQYRYIDGYTWRFELDVESPHRPEAEEYELVSE